MKPLIVLLLASSGIFAQELLDVLPGRWQGKGVVFTFTKSGRFAYSRQQVTGLECTKAGTYTITKEGKFNGQYTSIGELCEDGSKATRLVGQVDVVDKDHLL